MWNSDKEIAEIIYDIQGDDSGIQWEELHQKSKEELLEIGFKEREDGVFLIPLQALSQIPDGMILTNGSGDNFRCRKKNKHDIEYRMEINEGFAKKLGGYCPFGIKLSDPDHDKLTIEEPKSFKEFFETIDLSKLKDYTQKCAERLHKDKDYTQECAERLLEDKDIFTAAQQLFERCKVYQETEDKQIFDKEKTKDRISRFRDAISASRYNEFVILSPEHLDLRDSVEKVRDTSALHTGIELYGEYLEGIVEEHKLEERYQLYQTYKQLKKEAPDLCALLETKPCDRSDYFDNKFRDAAFVSMIKHPEMVKIISSAKDNDGNPLFDPIYIMNFFAYDEEIIKHHPDQIKAVLSNPEEIDRIAPGKDYEKTWILEQLIKSPLQSTKEQNPQAFEDKSNEEANPAESKAKDRIEKAKSKIPSEKTPDKNNNPYKSFDYVKYYNNQNKDQKR